MLCYVTPLLLLSLIIQIHVFLLSRLLFQAIRERGPTEEEEEEEEDGTNTRRSKRVTKGKRFQFGKNERPVYQQVHIHAHIHNNDDV